MSALQVQMRLDKGAARRCFEEATSRFDRLAAIDAETLPFPARWHGGKLLVVKPDLRSFKEADVVHLLHGAMIRRDRQLQQQAKAYLEDVGVMALLEESLESRDTGAFDADLVDLAILHDLAAVAEPQQVLELGSGLSSVILGHAAKKYNGQLICLEPSSEWAEHTASTLPVSLRPHVSVICPAVDKFALHGHDTCAFRLDSKAIPDFIYVDGAPNGAWYRGLETVIQLERDLLPGTVVVIDCRVAAIQALLGLTRLGAPDERARLMQRRYDVFAQGIWVRNRGTNIPVGPCFGLDSFCNAAAMLTD